MSTKPPAPRSKLTQHGHAEQRQEHQHVPGGPCGKQHGLDPQEAPHEQQVEPGPGPGRGQRSGRAGRELGTPRHPAAPAPLRLTRPAPPHRPPAPAPRARAPSPSMLARPASGRRVTRVSGYSRPAEYSRAPRAAQKAAAGHSRARTTEQRSAAQRAPSHRHGGRERLLASRGGRAPLGAARRAPASGCSQPPLSRPCARCFPHSEKLAAPRSVGKRAVLTQGPPSRPHLPLGSPTAGALGAIGRA